MPDLKDGESTEMKGSAAKPYVLRNTGGVYSCDCPAWRNQSIAIERRTCKHLRRLRGDDAEAARVGAAPAPRPASASRAPTGANADEEGKEPPLLLAHSWENDVDLTGWWMSEKLDGVRAYWTGTQFLSRLGNVYHAPQWFLERLPSVPLDGELWCGRKKFQRCVSIARRQDKSDMWRELTYVVFDAPAMDAPFEERLAFVERHMQAELPRHARHHAHARCTGIEHLKAELARVEALGGEGLMLRQPGSRYEVGRSSTLLKVKSFRDAEARVVEHIAGAGRHKGRLGALGVAMADGTRFSIGTGFSDAERRSPPPIGAIVTFRYQELSDAGVPRFPSYVGVRDDVRFPPARPSK
jgi:DNA ligase-1